MMENPPFKETLDQLSRHIQDLQKKLIDTQKADLEQQRGRKITPYEMLELLQKSKSMEPHVHKTGFLEIF